KEPRVGPLAVDMGGGAELRREVVLQLLPPGAGQQADDRPGSRSLPGEEVRVEALAAQVVEVGMTDIVGGDAARLVPAALKWQRTQDMIDPAPHLADAPAGPAPDL